MSVADYSGGLPTDAGRYSCPPFKPNRSPGLLGPVRFGCEGIGWQEARPPTEGTTPAGLSHCSLPDGTLLLATNTAT